MNCKFIDRFFINNIRLTYFYVINRQVNARAARPLLTPKEYGIQYSTNYLRSYVQDEMNLYYKHTLQSLGSDDSWIPSGLKAALRVNAGGIKEQVYNAQYTISSVEELVNVFRQQTDKYQKNQQQQQQHASEAQQHPWSAEKIARQLNIQTEEREQLEASLWVHLGGNQRFFTLDNATIEHLPQALRDIENDLRSGKDFEYTKFINGKEIAISFPTEMAMPFIYTLDIPTVIHISGHVKASAEPKVSNGDKIQCPDTVKAQSEVQAILSSKLETQLGFFTPFDHQQYSSGYDKNLHINIPIKTTIEINAQNKEAHIQIQPAKPEQNTRVFEYKTYPYTAKYDILSLQPIAFRPNTQVIDTKPKVGFERVFGKEVGFAVRVKYQGEKYAMDAQWLAEQLENNDLITALMAPRYAETVQPSQMSLEYLADQSQNPKVHIYMGYDSIENKGAAEQEIDPKKLEELPEQPSEYLARRKQMVQMVSNSVKGSHTVRVGEVVVQLEGKQKVQYYATSAVAKSNVHPKSLYVLYLKKSGEQEKPYKFALIAKTHMPNTNGLDFTDALQFDPATTTKARVYFGESLQSGSKVNIHADLRKSDERKMYLQNLPEAHQCQKEQQEGNHQLPACANLTASANLLDRVSVHIEYENIGPKARNVTNKLYNALSYLGYYHLDEDRVDSTGKQNQLNIEARFEPDFEAVNVSIEAEKLYAQFKNIHLNEWVQRFVAVHPVFPVSSRLGGKLLAEDAFRRKEKQYYFKITQLNIHFSSLAYCVVDHTACNTFDNKTYQADLSQDWTVMMQYVPRYARSNQQQQQQQQHHQEANLQDPQEREQLQNEQYVVLVRDSKVGQKQKDVRMTLRTPASNGKLVEIELYPAKQSQPSGDRPAVKVMVNKKEEQFNDKQSANAEGDIEIYALPNGEVKVEVQHRFYIITDGQRVKLTTTDSQFRDAVRGLCGTFTGNEATDFRTPEYCIVSDPQQFIESYTISQQGQQRKSRQDSQQDSQCVYDNVQYVNVISERDAGLEDKQQRNQRQQQYQQSHGSQCTIHQVRYSLDQSSNNICFSLRPLPKCTSSCRPKGTVTKSIPMHCLSKSSVTDHWQKRIDEGASPDFSNKSSNKQIQLEIPTGCTM